MKPLHYTYSWVYIYTYSWAYKYTILYPYNYAMLCYAIIVMTDYSMKKYTSHRTIPSGLIETLEKEYAAKLKSKITLKFGQCK